jgi:hypothetical protein
LQPVDVGPALEEAALDVVDRRGLGVRPEGRLQVGVVGEVLLLVEEVGLPPFPLAGGVVVLLARGAISAEDLD